MAREPKCANSDTSEVCALVTPSTLLTPLWTQREIVKSKGEKQEGESEEVMVLWRGLLKGTAMAVKTTDHNRAAAFQDVV